MEQACDAFNEILRNYSAAPCDGGYLWRYLQYMLQWHKHNFDCIVLAQSPYSRPIHPCFASALAYDPMRCSDEPPTVKELADFLCEGDFNLRDKLAWCLRDSWRLLYGGMLFVNHNLGGRGVDANFHSQCVNQIDYIVSLVAERCKTSRMSAELKVISLGSDGTIAARMLASGLSKVCKVQVLQGKHPAAIARMRPEDKPANPILMPRHRSYMVQRILAAAVDSMKECVQVSEFEHYPPRGETHIVVPRGSLEVSSPGAEKRLLAVATNLRSTFPRPIICLGVGPHSGLEDGVGNNSVGRTLECYRDWLVVTMGSSKPTPKDSCAVATHTMSSGRYQSSAVHYDVDATARAMEGVADVESTVGELRAAASEVVAALQEGSLSKVPELVNLSKKMQRFELKCEAACASLTLMRAQCQAVPHYDSVSRPYGRGGVPLRSPGSPPPISASVPLNSSVRTMSVSSSNSSVKVGSPVLARAKRKGSLKPASTSSSSVVEPLSAVSPSVAPSEVSSVASYSGPQAKKEPEAAPVTPLVLSPTPVRIRARRAKPPSSVAPSTPPASTSRSVVSDTPTPSRVMSEYIPPLDEPESPNAVRVEIRTRPAPPQLSFSSLGAPTEIPHSSSAKVGLETPSQRVLDTVARKVQRHSVSSSTSTVVASSLMPSTTGASAPLHPVPIDKLDFKPYIEKVRFWTDDRSMYEVSESLTEYMEHDRVDQTVDAVLELLYSLGETIDADLIDSIFLSECKPRYQYILDAIGEL